ncbi:BspA family leucine-rich repeat surface protein [Bifidobacterium bohemicum]|nr:BspA family leucine-rich repeat surface protein [Bifidobacterium bohemicum]
MKIGGMMRSMRNVAVGLLVAAAVAVCPVIASADDQVNGVPGGGNELQAPATPASNRASTGSTQGAVSQDVTKPKPADGAVKGATANGAVSAPSDESSLASGQPKQAPQAQDEKPVTRSESKTPSAQSGDCNRAGYRGRWGTVAYDIENDPSGGCVVNVEAGGQMGNTEGAPWTSNGPVGDIVNSITAIVFEGAVKAPDDSGDQDHHGMAYLFNNLFALDRIEGLDNIDTTGVTTMKDLFAGDNKLKSVDVTGWSTSDVKDMSGMFSGDRALAGIKGISGWDTAKVTNMGEMFNGVPTDVLDLSAWKVGNVTSMDSMFSWSGVQSIGDVSDWDVSRVEDMYGMFFHSPFKDAGPLKDWHPDAVTSTSNMFSGDAGLGSVDLSGWAGHTPSLENMNGMLFMAGSLTHVTMDGWKLPVVKDMGSLFAWDSSLQSVRGLEGWKVPNVESVSGMFSSDTSFKGDHVGPEDSARTLDLSGWGCGK